jgi:hypothetical protein
MNLNLRGLGGGGGGAIIPILAALSSFGSKRTHPEQKEETKVNASRQKKNPKLSLSGTVRESADGSRWRDECYCEYMTVELVSILSLLCMKQLFLKKVSIKTTFRMQASILFARGLNLKGPSVS